MEWATDLSPRRRCPSAPIPEDDHFSSAHALVRSQHAHHRIGDGGDRDDGDSPGSACHRTSETICRPEQPSSLRIDGSRRCADSIGLDTLKAVYAVTGPLAVYVRVIDLRGNVLERSTNSVDLFAPTLPHDVDVTEIEHREDGVLFRTMYGPLLVDGEHIGWLETSAYG